MKFDCDSVGSYVDFCPQTEIDITDRYTVRIFIRPQSTYTSTVF